MGPKKGQKMGPRIQRWTQKETKKGQTLKKGREQK